MRRACLLAIAVVLLGAGEAAAHSIVRVTGAELTSLSADATSLNTLTARLRGSRIELRDPTVDGGMDIGPCEPGDVDATGFVIQAYCPRAGVSLLRIDAGDREDTVTAEIDVPLLVLGGEGADRLTTGPAKDTVRGDAGDDVISTAGGADTLAGGLGVDTLDAGAGDDQLDARDGQPDVVRCGPGVDALRADQLDEAGADCERVDRVTTAPPPEEGAAGARDRTAPTVEVGAATVQRVGSAGVIRVAATASERGTLAASGFLDVAGLALPLLSRRERVSVAGGGAELRLRLSARQLREVRRVLRRGRRVRVRLRVVATDAAGNSGEARAPVIALRR